MRDFTGGGLTYVLSYFGMIYKKRGHGILKEDDTRADFLQNNVKKNKKGTLQSV